MRETPMVPKWTTAKQFDDIVQMMIYHAEAHLRECDFRAKRRGRELAEQTEAYLRRESEGWA